MRPRHTTNERGFTLVELMVVIGIIGLLAGVLVVAIGGAFSSARENETETLIETVKTAIDRFDADHRFLPPGNVALLATYFRAPQPQIDPNPFNNGIEALVLALRSRYEGGPFLSDDVFRKHLSNTDEEEGELTINFADIDGNLKLYELRDSWDNPLVYINLADIAPLVSGALKTNQMPTITVKTLTGLTDIDLMELDRKLRDPETGIHVAQDAGYVLWSFGPDGINDYGGGDDITSWKKIQD